MILVTGATGFIGSYLMPRLASFSKVRCLVRPPSIPSLKKNASVEIIPYDFLSPDSLDRALEGVHCVIHMAALLRKKSPDEIRKVNVEGTQRLLDAARNQGVSHFIFTSTENALRENLSDAYAQTKREAEVIVQSFPNHLILRPSFVYGRGDTHGLGRLLSIAEKYPVVPLFGGLKQKIQPLYIEDMTEYLLLAVQKNLKGEFIVAGSETVNLNDFMKRMLRIRSLKKMTLPIPYFMYAASAMAGDLFFKSGDWGSAQLKNIYQSRTYSIEETIQAFGYTPRSLEAGLRGWLDNK